MTKREVILTTGAAGRLGRLVVQTLHRDYEVVAVDRRPIYGLPKDVKHVRTDLRGALLHREPQGQGRVALVGKLGAALRCMQ